MAVRFLEVIKPFCAVLPEVEKPQRRVGFFQLKFFANFSLDSISRKGPLDCDYTIHFLGMLSNPALWHYEFRIGRSLLLDSCDFGF